MMHHLTIAAITIVAAAAIISVSAIIAQTETGQAQLTSGNPPFEINTAVSEDRIVITIVRSGAGEELPDTPIVIIPPNETAGEENATVITPGEPTQLPAIPGQPIPPANITIIEPDGNITEIPAGNITETPGNVTVIDPPAPEACTCPEPGVPTQLPIIPTADNDTTIITNETTVEAPPAPVQLPAEGGNGGNGDGGGDGNGNGNGNGDDGGG